MSKPVISVIVPVHNAERTLDACVASVALQGDCVRELILVNDASTDGSAALIAGYAARYPRLRVISLKSAGRGVSEARNTGIYAATGEYIAFLDDDDEYMPGAFSALLGLFERFGDADIAVGQFKEGEYAGADTALDPHEAIEATLYQMPGFHESAWGKLYRRSLFDGDTLFVSGRRYEDLEQCPRIYARARKVAFTPQRVYRYKPREGSFLNTWSEARADALWAVDTIAGRFGGECPGAARSRRFSAYFNLFNLATANSNDEIVRRCWTELKKMRAEVLRDGRCRMKNRIAAALSYGGLTFTRLLSKMFR